jgi:hypothetical protein
MAVEMSEVAQQLFERREIHPDDNARMGVDGRSGTVLPLLALHSEYAAHSRRLGASDH